MTDLTSGTMLQSSVYDQTIISYAPDGVTVNGILFSGQNVTLSELANQFPEGGIGTLTIYADTLTVDVPIFNAPGVTIVARVIDISSLDKQDWLLEMPTAGTIYPVLECLIMQSVSNGAPAPLVFTTCGTTTPAATPSLVYTAPTNTGAQLEIGSIEVNADATITVSATKQSDFQDLLWRPYALNALYASFSYATTLVNADGQANQQAAFNILSWICNAIMACGPIPQTHAELFSQAASLLISLSAPANYHYLGVLSGSFYATQITDLINVINEYETSLDSLANQTATQGIVSTISTAMSSTASAELAPTQTELDQVNASINSLNTQIVALMNSIYNQAQEANTDLQLLQNAITSDKIMSFLTNSITTIVNTAAAVASSISAYSAGGNGAGTALAQALTAAQDAVTTIKGLTQTFNTGTLTTTAQTLMQQNQQLCTNTFTSLQLWNQANSGNPGSIAFSPTPLTIDPNVAWDNYMADVKSVLSDLNSSFPTGQDFSAAQAQSDNYLACLQKLANYGKAFNAQQIAYSRQLCQGVVLLSKISATKNVTAIWNSLSKASQTEQEQLVALQSMLQSRMDNTRRTLFVAWTNYRSAYLYNNLAEPGENITMDMPAAALSLNFAAVQSWVSGMPADGAAGTTQLPNDNATITLTIPIVDNTAPPSPAPASSPAGLIAYIAATPGDPDFAATVTLNIADSADLFSKEIGTGNVAVWITAGTFAIKGIGANANGYVPMVVATSGQYTNGYQDNPMYFSADAISSHFSYIAGSDGSIASVNVPWQINSAVYMLPTPFTLWSIKVQKGCDITNVSGLEIKLTVNLQFEG